MKLVHYMPRIRLEDGGTVRAALDMCRLLAERGHDVRLVTGDGADVPAAWRSVANGVPRAVILKDAFGPAGVLRPAAARAAGAEIDGAAALHLHGMWSPSNVQIARLARRRSVPYVVTVHGMLDDWCMSQRTAKKRVYLGLVGTRWLRGAAAVHCTAAAELEQARRWLPHDRTAVIPYIFDLDPYRDLPGPELANRVFDLADDGVPRLLFLSRLHHKKGPEAAIRAVALLKQRGRPCRLLIAGSGEPAYERSLRVLAAEVGAEDAARFIGFASGREKTSLYQAADVFVLPTNQENFGLVLAEALACRTPVVTTRNTDVWPELLESGGARIVPATPEALADAIEPLLAEPDRRRAMGEAGQRYVFEWLDPLLVVGRFEALYESISRTAGVPADTATSPMNRELEQADAST